MLHSSRWAQLWSRGLGLAPAALVLALLLLSPAAWQVGSVGGRRTIPALPALVMFALSIPIYVAAARADAFPYGRGSVLSSVLVREGVRLFAMAFSLLGCWVLWDSLER